MYDVELAREILRQVQSSIQTIAPRFEPIRSPEDFTHSEEGRGKPDAICMQRMSKGITARHGQDGLHQL